MKKIALTLALILSFALVGCTKDKEEATDAKEMVGEVTEPADEVLRETEVMMDKAAEEISEAAEEAVDKMRETGLQMEEATKEETRHVEEFEQLKDITHEDF